MPHWLRLIVNVASKPALGPRPRSALPVMVTLLFINIGIGVITRAAPSLNIFAVGLPATIAIGFLVLLMSMGNIGARLQWLWTQGLTQTRILVGLS